jgi:hypothetical protein
MSVLDAVSLLAAFGALAWFVWMVVSSRRDEPRHAEDEARDFFDAHGHWPDEDPATAQARLRRGEAAERAARALGRRRR